MSLLVLGPIAIQGAGNGTLAPPSCTDNGEFGLLIFILFAFGNFILQERLLFPERWKVPSVHLSNGNWLAIFTAALFVALAFVSLAEMLPYWINGLAYAIALLAMVLAAIRAAIRWTEFGHICAGFGCLVYLIFFGYMTVTQYEKQHDIDIVFKTSVSEYRRFITQHDLSEFRDYFRSLDIPTPADGPIVGIDKNGNCFSFVNPQKHQSVLRPEIFIGEKCLTREEMTLHYSSVVIEHLPQTKNMDSDIHHVLSLMFAQQTFTSYFNWSFWGKPMAFFCPGTFSMNSYTPTLWKIRERLGRDFTDRLAAYAVRITADDPMEGMDGDSGTYFARKLKAGNDAVDDGKNWPLILEILKSDGIKVENI